MRSPNTWADCEVIAITRIGVTKKTDAAPAVE